MSELRISRDVLEQMVGHCFDAYPLEGCGLLAADLGDRMVACFGLANAAESARLYELDSEQFMAADREADSHDLTINAVFHSYTRTDAYPSPTDVAKASVPEWHHVVVSFAGSDTGADPDVRSYRIIDGDIEEEPIIVF